MRFPIISRYRMANISAYASICLALLNIYTSFTPDDFIPFLIWLFVTSFITGHTPTIMLLLQLLWLIEFLCNKHKIIKSLKITATKKLRKYIIISAIFCAIIALIIWYYKIYIEILTNPAILQD